MIIHDKMVDVIRNALVDYESATGLECQIRYADRLSAVVEVVLELAEDSNVGQVSITVPDPFVAVNATQEQVTVEQEVEAELENHDKYKQVMEMREKGIKVADIAKTMDCSVNMVYNYLKYAREMENK